MKRLYFLIGSQDLYGDETLKQAQNDGYEMASFLNEKLSDTVEVKPLPIIRNSNEAFDACATVNSDKECVGVIMWMHTFSPAKMWIRALQSLQKPMLHLHTQFNEKLPYSSIDMDFMNLNQSAHGDREFGFICTRLNINREVVVGYYKNESVIEKIKAFASVAKTIDFSKGMRVAMFGTICVTLQLPMAIG